MKLKLAMRKDAKVVELRSKDGDVIAVIHSDFLSELDATGKYSVIEDLLDGKEVSVDLNVDDCHRKIEKIDWFISRPRPIASSGKCEACGKEVDWFSTIQKLDIYNLTGRCEACQSIK